MQNSFGAQTNDDDIVKHVGPVNIAECLPLTEILPAGPAVSFCPPLVAAVLFSQSLIQASRAGWSRLAAKLQTHRDVEMD